MKFLTLLLLSLLSFTNAAKLRVYEASSSSARTGNPLPSVVTLCPTMLFDSSFTIECVADAPATSATFMVDGKEVGTERVVPYILTGDNDGFARPWVDYPMTATVMCSLSNGETAESTITFECGDEPMPEPSAPMMESRLPRMTPRPGSNKPASEPSEAAPEPSMPATEPDMLESEPEPMKESPLPMVTTRPESSKPAPESSKPAPESSKPAPESSKPAPESSKPAPESSKPAPESSKPAPESSKPAPESSKPAPESDMPESSPETMPRAPPAMNGDGPKCVKISATSYESKSDGWVMQDGGMAFKPDDPSMGIDDKGDAPLVFKFTAPASGRYAVTLDMKTSDPSEHNDVWLFPPVGGFSLEKPGSKETSVDWTKAYHNSNDRSVAAFSVDFDPHAFSTKNSLNAGQEYTISVGGRSTKVTIYSVVLFTCKGDGCFVGTYFNNAVNMCA